MDSRDVLDLPATSDRLLAAFEALGMPIEARRAALACADRTPDLSAWRRFLLQALLLLGAALVLAGIICFFASNWASLGRFGKFALIDAAIAAGAIAAWRRLDRPVGQVALTASAVLVGPLIAVYGQTYQTGADPWGLFAGWAFLIVPWVVAARFTALWAIELLLVDVGVWLFWSQALDVAGTWDLLVLVIIGGIHAGCVAAWEWQRTRARPWLDEVWAPRLAAAAGLTALLFPAAALIFDPRSAGNAGRVALVALGLALALVFWFYQRVRLDLVMLTAACGTVVAVLSIAFGRLLIVDLDLEVLGSLVMAVFVMGAVAAAVAWLRHVMKVRGGAE